MSNSVFKEYPSSHGSAAVEDGGATVCPKLDSNLVVFINKDGSVSVDQTALHDLLVNDATETNTSVSVIRVGSPTPSLQLELDEQEALEREMAKAYVDEDTENDEHDTDDDDDDNEEEEETTDHDGKVNGKRDPIEPVPNVCVTVESFFNPVEAKQLASDILTIAGISNPLQIKVDYEFQRYVIANDHCYTPYTSPSQRLSKKDSLPALATTMPVTIKMVPKLVTGESLAVNKSKPKGSPAGVARVAPQPQQKKPISTTATTVDRQQLNNDADDDDGEDDDEQNASDDELDESDSDESYFSPSESENDRDSDLDFNVNDRPSRMRKYNRSRSNRTVKLAKTTTSKVQRKRPSASLETGNNSIEDEAAANSTTAQTSSIALNKKKVAPPTKILKKPNQPQQLLPQNRNPVPMIAGLNARGKILGHVGGSGVAKVISVQLIKGQTPKLMPHNKPNLPELLPPIMSITSAGPPALAPISIVTATPPAKPTITMPGSGPKKEKKPPAHVEALFSDIKSLFSTPDIIKSVGENTKIPSQQPLINIIPAMPAAKQQQPQLIAQPSQLHQNKSYFMALQPGSSKQRQFLPAHISVRTHAQGNPPNLGSEQDKQLDLIDSIVQHELQHNLAVPPPSTSMNVAIPSIVKMLEHTPDGLIGNVIALNQTQHPPATTFAAVDSTLLDEADLLDGLANAEDGLTEDLLQHVAKLVEDKNLQEVIDKQVLGVTTSSSTITTSKPSLAKQEVHTIVTPTPSPPVRVNPFKQKPKAFKPPAVQRSPAPPQSTPEPAKPSLPPPTSKEPIKIIRADGRVITLPPIEAPTTRGAKRRALIQPPTNAVSADPSTSLPSMPVDVATTPLGKDRRHSVAVYKKTDTLKERRPSMAAFRKLHQDSPQSTTPKARSMPSGDMAKLTTSTPNASTSATTTIGGEFDDEDDDDDGSDGSYNSEDDPYRLWCICRQPHNNRFMICCDKCEDWFHGKCVNVTKAMGTAMEERFVEWVCPNCIKKNPQQQTLPQMTKKMMGAKTLNPTKTNNLQQQQLQSPKDGQLSCIVCTNVARQSSIYCSDDCIRKHATTTTSNIAAQSDSTTTTVTATNTPATTDAQLPSSVKWVAPIESNQHNRVDVFEKKSGRCLTGNSAPTVENLRQWLQTHPTFEVVQNGSAQAVAIKAKKLQHQLNMAAAAEREAQQPSSQQQQQKQLQTTLNVAPNKRVILVNPHKQATKAPQPQQLPQPQQAHLQKAGSSKATGKAPPPPKEVPLFSMSSSKQQRGTTAVTPTTTSVKSTQPAKMMTPAKSQAPVAKPSATIVASTATAAKRKSEQRTPTTPKTSTGPTEPIRVTVQKTLREQLTLRMSETTDNSYPKLSADEIARFAAETEREIYHLFSRDTGSKYRAKYRSLMFNIKDRKNETLFRKICEKSIKPKQLTRLSPEDLASQELAQWREKENKHHLEMIKKSELDLLACAKSYVLKTHKGEEVIESKVSDRVSLDPSTSVEDVVSVLNNSTVSSTSEHVDELLHQTPAIVKDTRIDSRFEKYLSVDSSSSSGVTLAGSSKTAVLPSASTKKKAPKRSRSRSRERDASDAKKSSTSKHKRKRSRERRSRSRSTDHSAGDKIKKDEKRDKEKLTPSKSDVPMKPTVPTPVSKDPPKPMKKEENFNLIDKILEAQSTIDRILRPDETAKKVVEVDKNSVVVGQTAVVAATAATDIAAPVVMQVSNESDTEPSSTVTIPTPPESLYQQDLSSPPSVVAHAHAVDEPPLWSGNIIMVDVTTFQIAIRPLSGDFSGIIDDLPSELDVVGRIRPDIVWDYIGKIKKSPYKEILVLRFGAAIDEDIEAYATFYTYLASRQRFGVIKTKSSTLKDFYLLPLAAHKSLPSVLQPLDRAADFENDRPDLLLGIIVKNKTVPLKRSASTAAATLHRSQPVKVPRVTQSIASGPATSKSSGVKQYTPPVSPKPPAVPVVKVVPIKTVAPVIDDGDEPYSPGGGSDEDDDDDDGDEEEEGDNDDDVDGGGGTVVKEDNKDVVNQKAINALKTTISAPPVSSVQSAAVPTPMPSGSLEKDEIQRKMEALTREIEAQKMEIADMMQTDSGNLDEPYSPTSLLGHHDTAEHSVQPQIPVLANISIPSNLQDILNSINKVSSNPASISHIIADNDEEYTPSAIGGSTVGGLVSYQPASNADYVPTKMVTLSSPVAASTAVQTRAMDVDMRIHQKAPSKLAQLTDEELLSMVPDDVQLPPILPKRSNAPTIYKTMEPLPPGVEDEYVP